MTTSEISEWYGLAQQSAEELIVGATNPDSTFSISYTGFLDLMAKRGFSRDFANHAFASMGLHLGTGNTIVR